MGSKLAVVPALACIGIGIGALIAPRRSSAGYGLPTRDPHGDAYVRGLGARDLTLGLVLLSLFSSSVPRRSLATALGLCAVVAAADFTIVATAAQANRKLLPLHALGAVALVALWRRLRSESDMP